MTIPADFILHQMKLGPLDNFLYFIGDKSVNEIAVIDPAWDVDFLCSEAEKHNYKITKIILTHGHPDHVNGLEKILERHPVPVYMSIHEAEFYRPKVKLIDVNDGDIITIGNIEINTIWMPGHTPGCQSLKYKDILISGDALFIDGCGRVDLPGGDADITYNTLYNVLMMLPDSTIIYPGHDYGPTPFATLASQKITNPYLTCQSKEEFLSHRLGL